MANPAPKAMWYSDTEWDTELAAVWYAANQYYGVSKRKSIEYGGIVFLKTNGKYGLTVRNGYIDGQGKFQSNRFDASMIRFADTPNGCRPIAVWHTHLPETLRAGSLVGSLLELFGAMMGAIDERLGMSYQHFSDADRGIAERASKASVKSGGSQIPIYLVTATLIKRYSPMSPEPVKQWPKAAPAHMGR